jgi:hypothetical protein
VADGKSRQDDVADKFDFGFAVDWMRKDLGCACRSAREGRALPVTALVDQFYARVQAEGGGRFDSSSRHPAAARQELFAATRRPLAASLPGGVARDRLHDRDLVGDRGVFPSIRRRRAVLVLG